MPLLGIHGAVSVKAAGGKDTEKQAGPGTSHFLFQTPKVSHLALPDICDSPILTNRG